MFDTSLKSADFVFNHGNHRRFAYTGHDGVHTSVLLKLDGHRVPHSGAGQGPLLRIVLYVHIHAWQACMHMCVHIYINTYTYVCAIYICTSIHTHIV